MAAAQTLYDKLWDSHVVSGDRNGCSLIYIDRQLLHEVSTPQAFVTLRRKGLRAYRPQSNLALTDHVVPTSGDRSALRPGEARKMVELLDRNVADFGIPMIPLEDPRQGIVHVVGPELGFTQPGITLACSDSHTSTHGAFGALAFGIGASECAIALATQCLRQIRSRTMRVQVVGALPPRVAVKDLALAVIAKIGADGAAGHVIEYTGDCVSAMTMEERMTLCNMAIEAGARVGLVAPDETTFAYLEGRPMAPKGALWDQALAYWRTLPSDPGAIYDRTVTIDVADLAPVVTWGTSPQDAAAIDAAVPDPDSFADPAQRDRARLALDYMGLKPGTAMADILIDKVFIGSCTNGRIEDLRAAAAVVRGRRVAPGVTALVVPGSTAVKRQAEQEGLHHLFEQAGFQWRNAGCSMCVAINGDSLEPGERCASTSNRNFQGRQGPGGRTHLMSPAMAAAAAIAGRLVDVRSLEA